MAAAVAAAAAVVAVAAGAAAEQEVVAAALEAKGGTAYVLLLSLALGIIPLVGPAARAVTAEQAAMEARGATEDFLAMEELAAAPLRLSHKGDSRLAQANYLHQANGVRLQQRRNRSLHNQAESERRAALDQMERFQDKIR